MNSRTGRIIALSQERRIEDAAQSSNVAVEATAPAASVFKIVTAAALMDNGVPLAQETCYSGGSSKLKLQHLEDTLPKNHACVSVTAALGGSVNAVFAKLSDRVLNRRILEEYAERFGFNHPIEFDVPIETSFAEIPEERLERARAAAGFWHTHLSPIHGAIIAQSLAQGGSMLRPYIVDNVTDASGKSIYQSTPKFVRHMVSKQTADQLKQALLYTTTKGTARKSFHTADGRPYLPGIDVAGKTGTLTGEKPYRAYTWFVGLAPLDKPEVAVSVLVVNSPKWRVKASQLAALILKKYFDNNKHLRD
jgi:cell division protein FtsI/penicillin-binding protein 2